MSDDKSAFDQDVVLDKPGIFGARWWQQSLVTAEASTSRRTALKAFGVAGGVLLGVGALGGIIAAVADDDYEYSSAKALELQKRYGWRFGASDVALVFDGQSQQPFDPGLVDRLERALSPDRYLSFHVPTLLDSLQATPRERPAEETAPFVPVRAVLRPIYTPAMERAFQAGLALAERYHLGRASGAVLVDLPGPESVAFAAGAAAQLEPVLLMDNWPHPRGVVPAHLALAAALYYQPLFEKRKSERTRLAPPLLVLDRARLAPYVDDSGTFDNRWTAHVPSATVLVGYAQDALTYVSPMAASDPELDDLNDTFVALEAAGIKLLSLSLDSASGEPLPIHPQRRATVFSDGVRPASFGVIPIVLAAGTGAVLGARMDRRGSWNRASSYGGG